MLKAIQTQYTDLVIPPTCGRIKDKSIIQKEQVELNIKPVHIIDTAFETVTFGMGCFWGAESLFGGTNGILRTRVGYSGGSTATPKYRELGDHTEVIEIDFDPKVTSFNDMLDLFWNNHEYGLGTKIKRQYMSLILYHTEEQKKIAEAAKTEEQSKRYPENVTTEIRPAGEFFAAEDYHQKYRLQGHRDLAKSLGLNSELLQKSYVAAKLNGFLSGVSGVSQFLKQAESLGLTPSQIEYIRYHVEKNEGTGLFC